MQHKAPVRVRHSQIVLEMSATYTTDLRWSSDYSCDYPDDIFRSGRYNDLVELNLDDARSIALSTARAFQFSQKCRFLVEVVYLFFGGIVFCQIVAKKVASS